VREQRRPYADFFVGLSNVVDLNCGQGEFLELLRTRGVSAYGVSSDPGASEVARKKSLKIVPADVFEHLTALPERSLGGIFSGGFLEHLPIRLQSDFLWLLASRLRPGAVAVIEVAGPPKESDSGELPSETSASGTLAPDLLKSRLEAHSFRDVRIFSLAAVECYPAAVSKHSEDAPRANSILEASATRCSPTGMYTVVAYRS